MFRQSDLIKRLSESLIAKLSFFVLTVQLMTPMAFASNLEEYHVKAAFIFNFIAFTQWPESDDDTIDLCIYGQDVFGRKIDELQAKAISASTINIVRLSSLATINDCQVLFISRSVEKDIPTILDSVRTTPILTVADSPGAADSGVMINMQLIQNKIKFEVNLKSAKDADLTISSKLLQLATEVYQ